MRNIEDFEATGRPSYFDTLMEKKVAALRLGCF